ncbi:hypothetical protein B0H67DRAFT_489280, partial [Lasiosphaeris hirsuta]
MPCEKLHLDRWDRPTCIARILARQRKEPQFSEKYESSDKYFQRLPNGSLANTATQMTVTLDGCATFCGQGTWYWDAIPRLTTWIIPIVLLLSNIELSPIDKHRFVTIIHTVGDPIDSFWSLLHKIYVWRRLHAMAVDRCEPRAENQTWWTYAALRWSVIATVLAGFEEISGAYIETELRYTMVLNQLGHIGHPSVQSGPAWQEWRQCARRLADARTNEFLRTLLAIFVYIFSVVAALDDDIGGGSTSRPGGRIGSAVFLMWLVPLALFSNVIGTFTSRRTCLTIMRLFVQNSRGRVYHRQRHSSADRPALIPIPSWTEYFHSLHWLGAVYTYRPWKLGYRSVRRKSAAHYASNWFLYLLSLFPIFVSAVGAFVIMWYAVPVGWSCRHIWVVGLTVAWLLSNLFTIW